MVPFKPGEIIDLADVIAGFQPVLEIRLDDCLDFLLAVGVQERGLHGQAHAGNLLDLLL